MKWRNFEEAGLPKGVVNVVFGAGSEVGDAMVEHSDIRVISFTGSNDTGRMIAGKCGQLLKKYRLKWVVRTQSSLWMMLT